MKKNNNNKRTVIILLIIAAVIIIVPLVVLKGAQFGGSDDAGSKMVSQVNNGSYTPWFTPVIEKLTGGTLPSEMETLLFCVQTAIGTAIIFFFLGRFYERKKLARAKIAETKKKRESNDSSR